FLCHAQYGTGRMTPKRQVKCTASEQMQDQAGTRAAEKPRIFAGIHGREKRGAGPASVLWPRAGDRRKTVTAIGIFRK
ncbi:MAG: hypothetical protein IKN57_03820, partial [Parasporobacterium sp.]|nr:hypothetical protein [Parasporobacterium sp.]